MSDRWGAPETENEKIRRRLWMEARQEEEDYGGEPSE
jgi:hypothetical protein